MLGFSVLEVVEFVIIIMVCISLGGLLYLMKKNNNEYQRVIHNLESDHLIAEQQATGVEKHFIKLSNKLLYWVYSTLKSSTKITDDVKTIYESCEISRHTSNKIKETFKQFDEQSEVAVTYIEDLRSIAKETYQTHQNMQRVL